MLRKAGVLTLVLGVLLLSMINTSVMAQDGANARTLYQLNMRSAPEAGAAVVTILDADTPVMLEARTEDNTWVLARTMDGTSRGWLSSLYLAYTPGFSAFGLPVSNEVIPAGSAAPAANPPAESNPAPEQAAPQQGAPSGVTAYASYLLNARSGPGTGYAIVGEVPGGIGLILEGRNEDGSWVLAHTEDNAIHGWLSTLYIRFVGVSASNLPYSGDTILAATGPDNPLPRTADNINYYGIMMGGYDPARIQGIDLTKVPIVGNATGRARQIFAEGRAMGRDPHVLAKVGDCSSEHWYFLNQFAWGQYDLGDYGYLQGVIDQFGQSLAYGSEATHNGFNSNSVSAPEWANPAACQTGESPLLCEYRLHNASVSIIMFGTSDLLSMTPYEFDFYMRSIVDQTIEQGVIPVLSTFPGNQGFWDRTIVFNQIVVRLAWDYDLPLMNLWLALENLPNNGLESDGFHLGLPIGGETSCLLYGDYLSAGYNTRNLVTLQTLNNVWQGAMR